MSTQTQITATPIPCSLTGSGLGARGLEGFARNPDCRRRRALSLSGITPRRAVEEIYGEEANDRQSPLALAVGSRFERRLFDNNGQLLLELYHEAHRLRPNERSVVNMAQRFRGRSQVARDARYHATRDLLLRKSRGEVTPHLILHARLRVVLHGVPYEIEPDALFATDADCFYRPVEIKSYEDRGGKTDSASIRGACRQAAVGEVGLRHALDSLGVDVPEAWLDTPWCDLILRRPQSMQPTLRPMTIEGEVHSLERALASTGDDLMMLAELVGEHEDLASPDVLNRIPNNYSDSCREHCALARICKRQALDAAHPCILGDRASEECAPVFDMNRILELVHGRLTPAHNDEAEFVARLRTALQAHRSAF